MTKEFRVYREDARQGNFIAIVRIDDSNKLRIHSIKYFNNTFEVMSPFTVNYSFILAYESKSERIC